MACVHELLIRALYSKKHNAKYAYIAPFRSQAKQIAWKYLQEAVEGIATEVRESDLSVKLPNGAVIALYGSDNPNSLRGNFFDGVILDEFADCRPSLWAEVILPTLADRKGWGVVCGTPKGKGNQFYVFAEAAKERDNWFHMELRASESGILDEEELEGMRLQMSEAQYNQELEVSFTAALLGTYYSKLINEVEKEGRINNDVNYDPNFQVSVSADIGYSDSTVLFFFQERPDGLAIIDCEEGHGQPLSYYFELLENKPYEYDNIWLPHDARAKTLQTGKSTVEQFLERKLPVHIVPQLSVQHGIDAVRMVLPYCWFNKDPTKMAIEALRTYRRKYDEMTKAFADKPHHDWCSDFADSFRYMALVANKKRLKPPEPVTSKDRIMAFPTFTLDQLHADRQKRGTRVHKMRI